MNNLSTWVNSPVRRPAISCPPVPPGTTGQARLDRVHVTPGFSGWTGNGTISRRTPRRLRPADVGEQFPGATGTTSQPRRMCRPPVEVGWFSAGGTAPWTPARTPRRSTGPARSTSVYYGGLVYWSATDPTLTVNGDGTAALTATVSGRYAASQSGGTWRARLRRRASRWRTSPASPSRRLASPCSPSYLRCHSDDAVGRGSVHREPGDRGCLPAELRRLPAGHRPKPYWYSSGSSRDAAKIASPLSVGYTTSAPAATPAITTQPTAATVTVGGTASFTAAASGTPTPTVQWQLLAGPNWQDYPGATSTTFNLNVPSVGYNGVQVRAVFTNSAGTATTNAVALHGERGRHQNRNDHGNGRGSSR